MLNEDIKKRLEEESETDWLKRYKEKSKIFKENHWRVPKKYLIHRKEHWDHGERFWEYGKAVNYCVKFGLNLNQIKLISKNPEAEIITGMRDGGNSFQMAWELDYACPICGDSPVEVMHENIYKRFKELLDAFRSIRWDRDFNQESFNQFTKESHYAFSELWEQYKKIVLMITKKEDNEELNEVELDHITFSEYNYFMYCKRCNLDIPSFLCLKADTPRAVEIYTERYLGMFKDYEEKFIEKKLKQYDREELGKLVRIIWVNHCFSIGDTKPSHIALWNELSEEEKEVDRQIGESLTKILLKGAK
jgi:hypothetical protein